MRNSRLNPCRSRILFKLPIDDKRTIDWYPWIYLLKWEGKKKKKCEFFIRTVLKCLSMFAFVYTYIDNICFCCLVIVDFCCYWIEIANHLHLSVLFFFSHCNQCESLLKNYTNIFLFFLHWDSRRREKKDSLGVC